MQNDIDTFREIKSFIQKNPKNFKSAGQWLDGLFPNNLDFIIPMAKAFTKADCEYPPDSRKIMLIAWLVTDKYLFESKLGITKYEQYAFRHEVIRPGGNGLPQLLTEQELAKDAVLARPDAMKIIQDAYLSYKGLLPEESGGKVGNEKKPKKKSKIKGWIVFIAIILGVIWTCIQIYESQTFKSVLQKVWRNDNNQLKILPPKMPNAPANYEKTSPSNQTKISDPNRNSP